ncbi:hypothetical protein M9H77_07039 [Catharanthus roseus]|uniref:Uncharacterized protein n=1 Tax=Catharanthus roseus TaxID=4058 RepID=A0ACC0BU07_CATRO|nr:hypothetical protein M9H77_07039 [Catharanthus roseus]
MVDEVLCLSAQQGYTIFYRNCEKSNILSDIVVAHPTSIVQYATIRSVGMTPTAKNFIVTTVFMFNEQGTTYIWVLQQIKVWTSQVLHFGVEKTNRAESEYSVLKLWLSTCHGDLNTVFLISTLSSKVKLPK